MQLSFFFFGSEAIGRKRWRWNYLVELRPFLPSLDTFSSLSSILSSLRGQNERKTQQLHAVTLLIVLDSGGKGAENILRGSSRDGQSTHDSERRECSESGL